LGKTLKHKTKNVLIAVTVIMLLAVVVNQTGYLGPRIDWSKLQLAEEEPTGPTGPTGPTTPQVTTGIVTSDVAGFDSLDISTARTIGTNVNCYWYVQRGGLWVLLGSGDAADLNIEEQDANVMYAVCQVPSGQSFYVDYNKMLAMNSRLDAVDYADIDGDSLEEFIFTMDISSIPWASGTGKYTMPCLNVYLLTYDSSWAFGTAPADQTNIGNTTVTKYVEWYTAMSAEKKGYALSKVVLVANISDISKITLKKCNIPGIGFLDGSSFDQDVLTSSIKWTYDISILLYGADYLQVPANTLNKQEFTTAFELDLSDTASDVVGVTLYLYYLDNLEGQKSNSDTMAFKNIA